MGAQNPIFYGLSEKFEIACDSLGKAVNPYPFSIDAHKMAAYEIDEDLYTDPPITEELLAKRAYDKARQQFIDNRKNIHRLRRHMVEILEGAQPFRAAVFDMLTEAHKRAFSADEELMKTLAETFVKIEAHATLSLKDKMEKMREVVAESELI